MLFEAFQQDKDTRILCKSEKIPAHSPFLRRIIAYSWELAFWHLKFLNRNEEI